jgi:hypothetical protein
MATIHLKETTTATPEQFVAALTDFGPGPSKLFGRSADDYLKGAGKDRQGHRSPERRVVTGTESRVRRTAR